MKVGVDKIKRLEDAVKFLILKGLVDGKAPVKSISEKMNRHKNNVSSAISGDERYFTKKFIIDFCATYNNIVSPDWIFDGIGVMSDDIDFTPTNTIFETEELERLSKDQLIMMVKELITLHNEQSEMYRMVIKQNEEMIRNGQERFNNITNIIFKNV